MTVAHWTDISRDPNARPVLRWRQELLDQARRPPVVRRPDHLVDLARGRKVLDVGVVEHFHENRHRNRWLHRELAEVASSCKGIDILADDVEVLRGQGFDVETHDLTEAPMAERYELVVMGEIVEHLGAPEPFLRNVRESLADGGRVVLTTPNPYMVNRVWHTLHGRFGDSVDHALLLSPANVFELASRAGLEIAEWRGVQLRNLPGWRNAVTRWIRRALIAIGFAEEIACETLIYELVIRSPEESSCSSS